MLQKYWQEEQNRETKRDTNTVVDRERYRNVGREERTWVNLRIDIHKCVDREKE